MYLNCLLLLLLLLLLVSATPAPTSSPFEFTLVFEGNVTPQVQATFNNASQRWGRVIAEGFSSAIFLPAGRYCGYTLEQGANITDLMIVATIVPIDGANGVLGSAGPCVLDDLGRSRFGLMQFDSADIDAMIEEGTLSKVIEHEMGHVLGIGSLWGFFELVSFFPSFDLDDYGGYSYLGDGGNAGNLEVGRTGQAVVEDLGGEGTAMSHWKEKVYDNELMTGFVEVSSIPMPLSRLTVGALKDLGFTVNETNADPYTVPGHNTTMGGNLRGSPQQEQANNKRPFSRCHPPAAYNLSVVQSTPKRGKEDQYQQELQQRRRRRPK